MKHRPKIDPKSIPNQSKIDKNPILEPFGSKWASWGHLGASWGHLGSKKVANMAPTWFPKRRQIPLKNNPKKLSKFWCLLKLFFWGFWRIWGGKMEPSWHQNRIKNRSQLRKAIFWKNMVFHKEKLWFWRFWGSKLEVKIDQKSIKKWSQDGKVSWHRFFMDFGRFWKPSWHQVGVEYR